MERAANKGHEPKCSKLAACDATQPPMRNTISTIKVGALTDDKFTNANLAYVCGKVQQWVDMHFGKYRFPAPVAGSHLVDIRVFDTVEGVRCKYDQDEQAFKPAPPASAAHMHSTVSRLEIVNNLNMQDTQTLLHQHLPSRPLKNLVPYRRALTGFN